MGRKSFSILLFVGIILISNNSCCQNGKHTANQFAVRIFSSANFMGYLEPCG